MFKVDVKSNVLGANELLAAQNRRKFKERGVVVMNMMSSPGSGKTSILEQTVTHLKNSMKISVIEGDLFTDQDAKRLEQKGVAVVQINTKGACHLDARMVDKAFEELPQSETDLLVIENVGNLVCPAEFDLGEDFRVVVLSVTEGNDKPLKYPLIFHQAQAVILNKMDLLPHTDFDVERFKGDLVKIKADMPIFEMSARTGFGLEDWCLWLKREVQRRKAGD